MMGKGFSYAVTEESIRKWMRVSAKMKLEWLEEINKFIWKYAPRESKRMMRLLREGKI